MVKVNSNQRGFSLIEVIVVVAILCTLMGLSIGITADAMNAAKADNSTGALMNVLEVARNQATSQRRDFQLVFTLPNKVEIFRVEIPSNATTLIETRYLENGQIFKRFTGVPDTPDIFRLSRRDCVRHDADDSVYERRDVDRFLRRRPERNPVRRHRRPGQIGARGNGFRRDRTHPVLGLER